MKLNYTLVSTEEDIDTIKSFFFEIFPEESSYDLKDFRDSVSGNHDYMILKYWIVKNENNQPIGFCGLEANNNESCWLGWFGVRPMYRRRGCAKQMLNFLLDYTKNNGFKSCRVYTDKIVNIHAYNLYVNHGFYEDSQYEYDFVTMVKPLVSGYVPKRWEGVPLGFESEVPPNFCM